MKSWKASCAALALMMPLPAMAEDVALTLWHMEQPPHRVARLQELIDAFNASHDGIKVAQEPQNWGEIYAKAPAALAAGVGPDIMFVTPDFVPVLKQVKEIPSVKDFVAAQDAKHDFIDSAVEAYSYEDGVWGVPLYNMSFNLWYHKSDLEKAGLEVPKTWAELKTAAETLTKDGIYGLGLPANKQLYTDQAVYSFMVNGGATEIYNEDGSLRFDNPETVASYAAFADLQKLSPPDSTSWTWGEAEACFIAHSCSMILQFTVITGYDTQGAGDPADLGVAAIPTAEAGATANTIAYANAGLILSDDAKKREAAEAFLAFLLEPENYGRFLNMEPGLFMPLTATGAKAESYWSEPLTQKYREQVEIMIANSQTGQLFGFTSGRTFPSISAISARNLIADVLQDIVVRGKTPAEAVSAGQAVMVEASAN